MTSHPYQAKFRLSPDGRGSMIRVLAPNAAGKLGNGLKVQQDIQTNLETGECFGCEYYLNKPTDLPAGKGGLGNKERMSRFSKLSLRATLAAMELEYGVDNILFPTLTLPSVDIAAFEGLARYSAYVANRLSMILDRYFQCEIFGDMSRAFVWEYQERGALHIHLVIACRCMDAISLKDFSTYLRVKWFEILEDLSGLYHCNCFLNSKGKEWSMQELCLPYIDVLGRENKAICEAFVKIEFVRVSVVAYLMGYLSKSNHDEESDTKNKLRRKFYPISTWCQWNRNATNCRKKWDICIDFGYIDKENLEAFDDCMDALIECVPIAKDTEIFEPENPYCEGYCFVSPRQNFPIEPIREFIADMRQARITRGQVSYLKDSFDASVIRQHDAGIISTKDASDLMQWNDVLRYKKRQENIARNYLKNICKTLPLLVDFVEKIGDIVNVQYPIYEQLGINYEP